MGPFATTSLTLCTDAFCKAASWLAALSFAEAAYIAAIAASRIGIAGRMPSSTRFRVYRGIVLQR